MRLLAPLLAMLVLMAAWPAGPANAAGCDIGAYEGACATKNGYYRIRTPTGAGPWPAVVYLYGSLGNSARQIENESFVQAFVDRGYAVIVPIALDLRYVDGTGSGWALRNERTRAARDDTAFIAEVLDDAEVRHRIKRDRVLITGMSRGGFLAWDIACHAPGMAAAYAPIAAGYLGRMPPRCAGPVRLLHTHGRADEVVSLEENGWQSGGARMTPLGEALATIARTDGCIAAKPPERFLDYDRTTWEGCGPGGSVDLLLHSGGHMVPLSWYSAVIDWFEGGGAPAPAVRTVGSPRFVGADGDRGGRFKKPRLAVEPGATAPQQ